MVGTRPGKTVLVIEGYRATRDALASLLVETGHHVLSAVGWRDAFELCARHGEDVEALIVDAEQWSEPMLELCDRLSARFPGLRVVVLGAMGAVQEALCGGQELVVLPVPVDLRQLFQELGEDLPQL